MKFLNRDAVFHGAPHAYFWRTHQGAELDLLVMHRGKRYGFEIKLSDAPTATKSMHIALAELGLTHLFVVYPGSTSYPLHERIDVVTIGALPELLKKLPT